MLAFHGEHQHDAVSVLEMRLSSACNWLGIPLAWVIVGSQCGCALAQAPGASDPVDGEIRSLIQIMPMDAKKQREAIEGLRRIGAPGVPYIIKYLNDTRALPENFMTLIPGPEADPRMPARIVSPTMVSSALMYLLSEITHESFGHYFYDFEVKSADDLSINQWRRWCAAKFPQKADVCWNEENGQPEKVKPLQLR
jgi:hypothetical protein